MKIDIDILYAAIWGISSPLLVHIILNGMETFLNWIEGALKK